MDLDLFHFGSFMLGVSFTLFCIASIVWYEASRMDKDYKKYLDKVRELDI